MPRDPPTTKPTIYRVTSTATLTSPSTLTVGRQQLLVGHNQMIPQPPSPYTVASSPPRQLPQLTPQYEGARPHTHSQTMTQAPSSAVDDHRSSKEQGGRHVSTSRRSTAASDSSQTPIDPPQFDFDELRKAQLNPRYGVDGNQGRNTSGTFLRSLDRTSVITFRAAVHPSQNPSRDNLAQYNNSGMLLSLCGKLIDRSSSNPQQTVFTNRESTALF